MSPSINDRVARISASLLLLAAILSASIAWGLGADDLDPSEHWKVGKISFSGNPKFSDSILQDVLRTKPRPIYTPWKDRPEFEPGAFLNDLKRPRIFYEVHGYYHSRITYDLTTRVYRKDKLVDAKLRIVEGQPVHVADIIVSIDGYHPPANTAPITKLPIHRGEIFDQQAYQSGQEILRLFFCKCRLREDQGAASRSNRRDQKHRAHPLYG